MPDTWSENCERRSATQLACVTCTGYLPVTPLANMFLLVQFSGTMKQAAVSELEDVLGQISKLLREAKGTFRKNRCVY
jgi:hypothetical protein